MDGSGALQKIAFDAKAGEVAADARARVLDEVVGGEADLPSMAAVAEAGGAFDWLADEPGLYADADLSGAPQTGLAFAFGSGRPR